MPPTDTITPAPAACPFCRSPKVATASKVVNEGAYWRCQACGQIWNPSRLKPARRY